MSADISDTSCGQSVSWGEFSSPYSSLGMKMSLKKNWAGMDSFPFTDLLGLSVLRRFLGQCTVSPISS